jgi:hypothetical protein
VPEQVKWRWRYRGAIIGGGFQLSVNNVVHGSIETVGTRGRGEGEVVSAGMCVARVAMVVFVREATITY